MTEFERALAAAWQAYSYRDESMAYSTFRMGFRAGWDASMEVVSR